MKSFVLPVSAFFLVIIVNFWAILAGKFWLENFTCIIFLFFAVLLVFREVREFSTYFFAFIGLTMVSYIARFFPEEYFANEISLFCLSAANIALILEAWKFIEPRKGSKGMNLYFVLILGVNFFLLAAHVLEMKEYIASNVVFWLYAIYYLNLFILGVTSFLYYLNSYSKKAVYFISLVLGLIFGDMLRDMSIFYFSDPGVELAESLIRVACAVFAVYFFVTKEKQLRLANLI